MKAYTGPALLLFLTLLSLPIFARAETNCLQLTRNLKTGSTGEDVRALQQRLNADADTQVAPSGDGSPGLETGTFGALTRKAVTKFQEKYASEILASQGLTSGTGIVGEKTRAKLNSLCSAGAPLLKTSTSGTSLSISAGEQPTWSLAPAGALYVPFTNFTLTAGAEEVTVNTITVERVGLGSDSAFTNIDLFDDAGAFIDDAYFKSTHRATFNEQITIPAGTSVTFSVVGDMKADLTEHKGERPALAVVEINASVPLSGALPIIGTAQTVNSSLVIGTATATLSLDDPTGNRTRYINDIGIRFSGIRVLAGSQEDIRLNSITWEQMGTVAASDIQNITTTANGVVYGTEVDGRYYTSIFPDGILVKRGETVDAVISGDITTTGSNRTIKFDITDATDVDIAGEMYGFGIYLIPGGNTNVADSYSAFITEDGTTGTDSLQPFFSGSIVTISSGAPTSITKN